ASCPRSSWGSFRARLSDLILRTVAAGHCRLQCVSKDGDKLEWSSTEYAAILRDGRTQTRAAPQDEGQKMPARYPPVISFSTCFTSAGTVSIRLNTGASSSAVTSAGDSPVTFS